MTRRRKFFPIAIELPNPDGHAVEREVRHMGWKPLIERQLGSWFSDTCIGYREPACASVTPSGRSVGLSLDIIGRANAVMFKLAHGFPEWSKAMPDKSSNSQKE